MANGIAIKDVDNKLQSLGGEEVIPISTGANEPEVVEVDTLKEYINEDIDTALEGKQDAINDLDTIRSGAALGATAIQSESDPTVHDWAKAEQKPSYTASEVGAVPTTRKINNKALSDDITLIASDVGALPDNTIIPDAQIQSDWNQSDNTKKDYIKNKPTIPAAQIQSDWNQSTTAALDYIKNKPTIPTVPTNVSAFNNDAGYLTLHQDISGKQDVLTAGSNINISNENVISATDTTYESKAASSGGTDVSLVTTGEKYTWNSKADPSIVPYIYVGTGTNWGPDSFDCYLRPAYFQGGVVPTKAGDYVYSTGTGCLHKCGTLTPVSGQTYNMTTPVYVGKINSYPGSAASGITSSNISTWNDKQDVLVSGTNIKTINNESLLGSGNISVSSGGTQVQADWSQSDNTQTDYIKNKPTLGTAATLDVASSGDAGTTEVVKGDDSRLTDARTPTTHSHTVSQITDFPTIPTVPTNVSAFTNDAGYTTNTGTITSVKMNGSTIASSGEADLGTVLTSHQDISGKADKVTSATNGNFAALDSNGNLTDSGHKHSDYLTSHQDLSNYVQKSSTAGLLKNDGTVDTSTYLTQHQDLSNYIQKSSTSGLVKNDGTIDTSTYLTQHQDISNYIQKSNTAGLVKNDGTVDTSTYLTSAPVTSVNGQTGAVSLSIPTVPSNIVTGLNSSGVATAYTIQVVASLPPTTESNTIYLIPE